MACDKARVSPKKNLTSSTSIQTAVFRLVLYVPVLCLVLMACLQVESYSRTTLRHKKLPLLLGLLNHLFCAVCSKLKHCTFCKTSPAELIAK